MRKLKVIKERVAKIKRWYKHLYECYCGKQFVTMATSVNRGLTTSCGCRRREVVRARTLSDTPPGLRHGHSYSRTYISWQAAKNRCTNPRSPTWKHYGGRGITMCARWANSFEAFLEDMGERPEGTSIDRIDNDGNYEPSNCRWADAKTQNGNKRRNAKKVKNETPYL